MNMVTVAVILRFPQKFLSTYIAECRLSILGIRYYDLKSIPHNSIWHGEVGA